MRMFSFFSISNTASYEDMSPETSPQSYHNWRGHALPQSGAAIGILG